MSEPPNESTAPDRDLAVYEGAIFVDSYAYFTVEDEDDGSGDPRPMPEPIDGTSLVRVAPRGIYVTTRKLRGWVDLRVEVTDRRPEANGLQTWSDGPVEVAISSTEGSLFVTNFEGPCDTFPHPIDVPADSLYWTRIWAAYGPVSDGAVDEAHERYLIQVWPDDSPADGV